MVTHDAGLTSAQQGADEPLKGFSCPQKGKKPSTEVLGKRSDAVNDQDHGTCTGSERSPASSTATTCTVGRLSWSRLLSDSR